MAKENMTSHPKPTLIPPHGGYRDLRSCQMAQIVHDATEELLVDFQDFLRQHSLSLWSKDHPQARKVRAFAWRENRSYLTYKFYFEAAEAAVAANAAFCVINEVSYLPDQQLKALEKSFPEEGGFTERLYRVRAKAREEKGWKK